MEISLSSVPKKSIATVFLAGFFAFAFAQPASYPSRPIEIIIPYDSGGTTDTVTRIVGEQLHDVLGVSVVHVNKPGGGGVAGAVYARQQKRDGYTLLAHASGFQITPLLDSSCPYKLEEFKPLAKFTSGPLILAVKKDSPWKSLEDFLAAARANPGLVTVGVPGVGTIQDFVGRLVEASSKTKLNPIVFKGDGPNLTALLGGHVQASIAGITALTPHLKSGDLKGLAITSPERNEAYGDIPTFREKGLDDATLFAWVGIFAPAGVPDPILKVLGEAFEKVGTRPATIEALKRAGTIPGFMNASDFDRSVQSEVARIQAVIKPGEVK